MSMVVALAMAKLPLFRPGTAIQLPSPLVVTFALCSLHDAPAAANSSTPTMLRNHGTSPSCGMLPRTVEIGQRRAWSNSLPDGNGAAAVSALVADVLLVASSSCAAGFAPREPSMPRLRARRGGATCHI